MTAELNRGAVRRAPPVAGAARDAYVLAVLSLQEISDRLEIQQLLVDYSTALDQRRFDDLDAVFTPDAYIDYRVTGGIDGIGELSIRIV